MITEKELLDFEKEWNESLVNNDAAMIGSFMSDDWIIVGTEGGITSKAEFLGWITSGDLTHSRMDSDMSRVRIYENTGIITSRGTSAGKFKGQTFVLYEWSTSIFIHANGKWQCVLTMLTPANDRAKDTTPG